MYHVIYRAKDSSGNWNDEDCLGKAEYIRTVHVVDTLKPVIALHYGSKLVHAGSADDVATHNGVVNPAGSWFGGTEALMADASAANTTTCWILGAAASVVAGLGLLALSQRGRAVAQDLPL